MWTLFLIWLAGGLANLGLLNGILSVEESEVGYEVKFRKFIQSWYAFGVLLGIVLGEIGKDIKE